MVLGAGLYQVPLITTAQKQGIYTIAVSPDGDYPGLKVADKTYLYDVRDEESILRAAQEEKIDGIVTDQTDIAVRTVAYVANNMGLPGIDYECAKRFTDKYLMRERCEELGLPTIKHRIVSSEAEAEAFLKETGTDAIIKPVDNQGSRGIYKIESVQDIKDHFEQAKGFSKSGQVIIEQFINGKEFEVDDIVFNGDLKTLMYCDIDLFDIPNVFASKTRIYPSAEPDEVVNRLLDIDRRTIQGLGLTQGLTHSEYKMAEDGTVYLLEAACRGGGAYVSSHITPLQTGLQTADLLIDMAMGKMKSLPEFETSKCVCATLCFYLPVGEVVSLEGVDEVRSMPFVYKEHLSNIKLGMKTRQFSDKTARYVTVVFADTHEELLHDIDVIRDTLRVKIKTENGIEGPIWG